jgi:hypothetical protein
MGEEKEDGTEQRGTEEEGGRTLNGRSVLHALRGWTPQLHPITNF